MLVCLVMYGFILSGWSELSAGTACVSRRYEMLHDNKTSQASGVSHVRSELRGCEASFCALLAPPLARNSFGTVPQAGRPSSHGTGSIITLHYGESYKSLVSRIQRAIDHGDKETNCKYRIKGIIRKRKARQCNALRSIGVVDCEIVHLPGSTEQHLI
ncbi:hypothetical protein M440DRAFT_279536 [Trichoderma longibrachiatum ATCC 18648]|uniref:Secreted protein n=1 Tax=Trichoderma longibrachiatum ATCC 18648 TaxID=983965 RepID=A0A2T4C776_TRILO|nr:hypothetical protein M440DRAFT_279536 [Trichoderma longibrachiatum ATCC 18648]